MSIGQLATALTVVFAISVVVLVGDLLYVLWRRRSFPFQSSPHPISGDDQHPSRFPTSDSWAKELRSLFCLKVQTRVEPSGAPTQKPDESSPDDQEIDVFKLLEANRPSRVLCTIKEEDREDVEPTSMSDVDSVKVPTAKRVCLQACLESESAEKVATAVDIDDIMMVVCSPCDSPMFFTPLASPARDDTDSVFVAGNSSGR